MKVSKKPKAHMPKIESRAELGPWVHLLKRSSLLISVPDAYEYDNSVSNSALRFWLDLIDNRDLDRFEWLRPTTLTKMLNLPDEIVKSYLEELARAGIIKLAQ